MEVFTNFNKNYYAVKILEVEDDTNFLEEINLINQLNYPTLLHLEGITLTNPKYIITSYCPNDNIQTYIDKAFKGNQDSIWTLAEKMIILLGTSFGMKYLHSNNIMHRDFKPQNILLDEKYYPIICDFGMSKVFSGSTKMKSNNDFVGSIQFISPELMDEEQINYKKADVYAFGMSMYSILCDQIPFYSLIVGQSRSVAETRIIKAVLFQGERPEIEEENISESMKILKNVGHKIIKKDQYLKKSQKNY